MRIFPPPAFDWVTQCSMLTPLRNVDAKLQLWWRVGWSSRLLLLHHCKFNAEALSFDESHTFSNFALRVRSIFNQSFARCLSRLTKNHLTRGCRQWRTQNIFLAKIFSAVDEKSCFDFSFYTFSTSANHERRTIYFHCFKLFASLSRN